MTVSKPIYQILIVDDRPDNLRLLERLLTRLERVDVRKATSGEEALDIAYTHNLCAAIVDVQMPGMDGFELVTRLRKEAHTANLPVIFITANYSDEFHMERGYEVGAVDFLSKPFNAEILLSKLRVFIELYEQRARLQDLNQNLEQLVEQRTIELQQAYQRLEKIDSLKSDFIQVAAHELRTPLTLISGYASLLEDSMPKDPQTRLLVQGIKTGQERLLEIINNMLDVTRIDSEAIELRRQSVSLNEIIKSVYSGFEKALKDRRIRVIFQGLEKLPRISADLDLMRKLFLHLITNAIKFTPDGRSITIIGQMVPGSDAQKYVKVQVEDSGIGIDPEYHQLIFEKFFQTGEIRFHSTSKTSFKGGGPGLGLSIARGIVRAHGGRIWVESPGYDETTMPGSTFNVVLPVQSET